MRKVVTFIPVSLEIMSLLHCPTLIAAVFIILVLPGEAVEQQEEKKQTNGRTSLARASPVRQVQIKNTTSSSIQPSTNLKSLRRLSKSPEPGDQRKQNPSPLTPNSNRQALRKLVSGASGVEGMKFKLSPPMKRSLEVELIGSATSQQRQQQPIGQQKKRFRTSGKALTSGIQHAASSSNTTSHQLITNSSSSSNNFNDLNNNSIAADGNDLANNNHSISTWRRNVDSINGTIDLSQYERNDIDRLYGDALLVYFKNFNETLPTRRELISLNGSLTESTQGRGLNIPIYRSAASYDSGS